MTLGIVQTIWNAFFDLISSTLTLDIIFYIGVGFLLLMSLFFFIKARTSYEYKLDKTADRLNDWLYRHQTITDQNLVEFNNIIKDRKSPKILRKYWQQYMLYRDKAPSEYMSTYNCIDKPLKTSSFTSSIKNFSMIYKITALVTFFLSMFCFASRNDTILTYVTQSMVASIVILFLGVVLTLALRAMQNYNLATLYQSFNVFARYIDKASTSIPKYVDFEILFTKQEINDGIPILGEYLEKRARQEQEELEEAQRNAVAHEEYDFSTSGIDGSLVLERAMKESETYLNIKQRLLTEIQQFESEIATLKKNYENTSKDYQRKLQASKENMERLRQQQEESTNRIEVNYIRKQQQDEVKKQEQLEKDQEDATNKFNAEINSLNVEIEKRRAELESKKKGVQEAMLNEYQTFSTKLHKSISDEVEKSKNESIQQVNIEKEQYAQAITYLKNEVDKSNELIKSKDQTIAELATKLQEYLGGKYAEQQTEKTDEEATNIETVDKTQEQTAEQEQEIEQTQEQATEDEEEMQGHYDKNGYYWFNNGTYYDNNNLYHDLEGNVFDADGNVVETGMPVEKETEENAQKEQEEIKEEPQEEPQEETKAVEEEIKEEPQEETKAVEVEEENIVENSKQVDSAAEEPEKRPEEQEVEEEQPTEQTKEEKQNEQTQENAPLEEGRPVEAKEPVDGKKDLSGNFTYEDGTYYDKDNLYHNKDGKVFNTEGVEVKLEEKQAENKEERPTEEKPKRKAGRPRKENIEGVEDKPKRKVGRPKKEKTEVVEDKPKRKAGRPKKEKTEVVEDKPKRKAGRPKKVKEEVVEEKPKRKVGRPKKAITEKQPNTKRKVGRPKKEQPAEEKPKRKAGRPKKTDVNDQSAKLLQQLGQSLLNITANNNNE